MYLSDHSGGRPRQRGLSLTPNIILCPTTVASLLSVSTNKCKISHINGKKCILFTLTNTLYIKMTACAPLKSPQNVTFVPSALPFSVQRPVKIIPLLVLFC